MPLNSLTIFFTWVFFPFQPFLFQGLHYFAHFTSAAEIQNKTTTTKSCLVSVIFFFCCFFLNKPFSIPGQLSYSLFHIINSNKPFFFQHPFSLNPFFLLGHYSPLTLLSVRYLSARTLTHRSSPLVILFLTLQHKPSSAQVLLLPPKHLSLTDWL